MHHEGETVGISETEEIAYFGGLKDGWEMCEITHFPSVFWYVGVLCINFVENKGIMKDNTLGIVIKEIPTSEIDENKGQIEGVPKNPRKITPDRFKALMDSIRQSPEMKELSEVVVYPYEGRYVVISGNHRARAYRKLGWETVRCKVLPEDTPKIKLREYVIKENKQYATDDERLLSSWDIKELVQWDVPMKLVKQNGGVMLARWNSRRYWMNPIITLCCTLIRMSTGYRRKPFWG